MKFLNKLTKEVRENTGYNPFDGLNIFLLLVFGVCVLLAFYAVPMLLNGGLSPNDTAQAWGIISVGALAGIAVMMRNLKMKEAGTIAKMSFLQLVVTPFIFLVVFFKIASLFDRASFRG